MMIKREKYLEEIRKVMGKQVIKVLLGMRRVGKSTLLLQIQEELLNQGVEKDQIISLNFEWLEFEALKEYKALHEYIESKKVKGKKTYIFLDEVQEVDGFEKVVSTLNAKGDAEVFITGSNSKLLSGELATYLTGRFYTIEVLPLSYKEVYEGFSSVKEGLPTREDVFLEYLRTGGMPGKFQFEEERTAKNYLMDMYQSILLRDIVKRYNVRDVDLLQRFMSYLINNIGQIFSAVTASPRIPGWGGFDPAGANEGTGLARCP